MIMMPVGSKGMGFQFRIVQSGLDYDVWRPLGCGDTKEVEYLLFGDLPLGLAEELVMLQKFNGAAHFGPFARVVVRVSFLCAHVDCDGYY